MSAAARTIRQIQPEIMDQADLDEARHLDALRGLARINRWSWTAATIWKSIKQLQREQRSPLRVLDVATGGGDVLYDLARRAQRSRLPIAFSGCDISSRAIEFAESRARQHGLDVSFFVGDALNDPLPTGFDILISSLFLHHLSDDEAVLLLQKMRAACESMVVISDLRRTRRGLWLARCATRVLTRSPVVHTDGCRSVQNAFTNSEITVIAQRAGLQGAAIKNCWPQRFLLCWRKAGAET